MKSIAAWFLLLSAWSLAAGQEVVARAGGIEVNESDVRTVLAATDDARLPEPVDLFFTSNTYHHLEGRTVYFRGVRERHLTPGGRVAIVEFRPGGTSHATARKTIEEEMTAAGFRLVKAFDYLERQHFLVFAAGGADPEEPPR